MERWRWKLTLQTFPLAPFLVVARANGRSADEMGSQSRLLARENFKLHLLHSVKKKKPVFDLMRGVVFGCRRAATTSLGGVNGFDASWLDHVLG